MRLVPEEWRCLRKANTAKANCARTQNSRRSRYEGAGAIAVPVPDRNVASVAGEAVEIRVFSRQGRSIREIARVLEVSRNTVRRYQRGDGLPYYERERRPGKLDHYKAVHC
jgi:hypothetical protein